MSITGVLLRSTGGPTLQRAIPLYLGIIMLAGVLFGPTAMHPRTVVLGMEHSWQARVLLWITWLLAATPSARATLSDRSLDYLRWLPVPQLRVWSVLGGIWLLLQWPWVLLFALGGGWLPAVSALFLGAGVHSVIAVRPRAAERPVRLAVLAAVLALLIAPVPDTVYAAVGAALWLCAVPLAWQRAPERHQPQHSRRFLPGATLALAQNHLLGLWRRQAGLLVRGLLLMTASAGFTYLLARANRPAAAELVQYSAVVVSIFATLACVAISVPMVEAERTLTWLLTSSGVGRDVRVFARLVATAFIGVLLATVHSALVIYACPMTAATGLRLVLGTVGLCVAQSMVANRVAHWSPSPEDVDSNRVVSVMTLVAIALLVALGVLGDQVIAVFLLLAFAVSWSRS